MDDAEINDRAHMQFFRLGVHYYAAGRFASLTGLFSVAGNLLHHAVEMFLKGALVRLVGLNELRNVRHDLNRLWAMFKQHFSKAQVADFDKAVAQMHRFERLRYPDVAIREGMEAHFALFRSHTVDASEIRGSEPRYFLVLEDFDALAKLVFELASVNPAFYLSSLPVESKAFLWRHNLHPLE